MLPRTKGTRITQFIEKELNETVNIFCSVIKTSNPTLKSDA